VIIAGVYLLARQFDLFMTAAVLEKFFAVIFIAVVVIFQEELRNFFEQVAVWSLNRHVTRHKGSRSQREEVEILVKAVSDLAREKVGALIVLPGRDMVARHIEGGVDLKGTLSEALLESIFDPHSIGHDGAAVIEGNRVTQFSCHLPLSKNLRKINSAGTRHAAALGLAEVTDALCLVVSEERGTISLARFGELMQIDDLEKLNRTLETFYQEIYPSRGTKPWYDVFTRNLREKVMAVVLSIALWFVFIFGSKLAYRTYTIPVGYEEVPASWVVQEFAPKEVAVTFRGPRSAFYFLKRDEIKAFVNLDLEKRYQKIHISSADLIYPKSLVLENIDPNEIHVRIEAVSEKKEPEKKPVAEAPTAT